MSTQDLVYNLPKLRTRSLQRRFAAAQHKTKRYLKTKVRRAKSQTVATYRRQYFLTAAGRDIRVAAAKNEDIFITSLIIAAVIGYCFAVTVTDLLLLFFQTALDGTTKYGLGMIPLSIAALGTLGILALWVFTFMLNTISVALMEGATGKQYRSVRMTLRKGLRQTGRVATVWLMIMLRLAAVTAIVSIAFISYIAATGVNDLEEAIRYIPYAGGAAVLIMLHVLLRYSLAPYVALFEPATSSNGALKRSRQLLHRRGKLFLLATYVSALLAAAALYGSAVMIEQLLGINKLVFCALGGLSIAIILNCTLVMLYRKRKLARK